MSDAPAGTGECGGPSVSKWRGIAGEESFLILVHATAGSSDWALLNSNLQGPDGSGGSVGTEGETCFRGDRALWVLFDRVIRK